MDKDRKVVQVFCYICPKLPIFEGYTATTTNTKDHIYVIGNYFNGRHQGRHAGPRPEET